MLLVPEYSIICDRSQIPKMLRADYTEDEGYVSEDMADSLDFDQDRYISKAISQSTQIIHQTAGTTEVAGVVVTPSQPVRELCICCLICN